MAAERKKSISVPQRGPASEERVMVFYWSVKLERERHWVRFGVLLDRNYYYTILGRKYHFNDDKKYYLHEYTCPPWTKTNHLKTKLCHRRPNPLSVY